MFGVKPEDVDLLRPLEDSSGLIFRKYFSLYNGGNRKWKITITKSNLKLIVM